MPPAPAAPTEPAAPEPFPGLRRPEFTLPPPIFARERFPEQEKTRLWPWVVGAWIGVGGIGLAFYLRQGNKPDTTPPQSGPSIRKIKVRAPVKPPQPISRPMKNRMPVKKTIPKPSPVAKASPSPPQPVAAPGLSNPSAPAPVVDGWRGREQEAIALTLKRKIYAGKRTIGDNAKLALQGMHQKELIHAADTGERLYLPDKMAWTALREEGPRYRVYLNFMAWQVNGERVQTRSDTFGVDLSRGTVAPADESTRLSFFEPAAMIQYQASPKAGDIESVLSAVDVLNRHKLRAVILKSSKQNKDEQKGFQAAVRTAENKFQRTIVYFRTKYAEKTLQNIAKAYGFSAIMKGK